MKKFLALLLCGVIMFSLCACNIGKSKKTATPDLNKLFSCSTDISYGDFKSTATIKRLGNGLWDVEFSSPSTLAGVKLSYNGEDIAASYKGLTFSVPKDAAPVKGVLSMIFNAIDKSADDVNMPFKEKEGMKLFSGESEQGDFTISVDKATGNLVAFEIPNQKLKVKFADYAVIQ